MIHSKVTTGPYEVSVIVEGGPHPEQLLVLAHGAGASMESDFMAFFSGALSTDKRAVARFNFPYMEQGCRSPGPAKASEAAYVDVVGHLRTSMSPSHVFIGGKSYGGRIASHIAAAGTDVRGLVFLGYPLHPPGRPQNMRDAHLYDIEAPMLFVEGTRDAFCPLPTLNPVLANLSNAEVIVVEDGDHSLKVRKSSGRATPDAWADAAAAIARWLDGKTS